MGKMKQMEQAIREADVKRTENERAVLTEAAQLLLKMQDCLEGIVSEQGLEGIARYTRWGETLLARSGQVALALKAKADATEKPQGGYYELMVRNLYLTDEAPVTSAYRTAEAARKAMEEDIRETLAAKNPRFDEEDVKRENADNVELGDEIRYEIEWKDLWG